MTSLVTDIILQVLQSPLHFACAKGDLDIADQLLLHGADMTLTTVVWCRMHRNYCRIKL